MCLTDYVNFDTKKGNAGNLFTGFQRPNLRVLVYIANFDYMSIFYFKLNYWDKWQKIALLECWRKHWQPFFFYMSINPLITASPTIYIIKANTILFITKILPQKKSNARNPHKYRLPAFQSSIQTQSSPAAYSSNHKIPG